MADVTKTNDDAAPPVPPEQPQTGELKEPVGGLVAAGGDPAGFAPDGPVEWAADLIRELALTGTGADKLDVIRRAQVDRFNDPDLKRLDESDPARHLTAAEALDALEAADVGDLTKAKARALVETGRYIPAVAATMRPADRIPAPPRGSAPKARAGGAKPGATGGPAFLAGPVAVAPGGAKVPTVGPKPVTRPPGPGAGPKPPDKPKGPPGGPKPPDRPGAAAVKDLIPKTDDAPAG